ncbi:TIGR02391 family protein [Micromonospora sp. NPDC051925]|uniref:TIGR02391 family protein n=1 Tax=Micromonospora sp. NPDC051925 TaxID=3364288 RepID=UPI0037C838D2
MRPVVAIQELTKLKAEAEASDGFVRQPGEFESWKGRVRGILVRALGVSNNLVDRFDKVRYTLGLVTDRTPQSSFDNARRRGMTRALGLVDAAVYELGLVSGDEPVDEHAYDPELWAHVKTLVDDEQWAMVASQTAIFVENQIRSWAGNPQGRDGNLVGKALYTDVFGDASDYRLGRQASEREGWRALGVGFAQALSNVDRHRIQRRDDAKRYALGVLGLGSLLLTQLRHEHGDILKADA